MKSLSRKEFLQTTIIGTAGIVVSPTIIFAQTPVTPPKPTKGPPLDKELVKEFVTIAHQDFPKVKAMLAETPDLINASHNWTDWDWEDAIGAAGHMGLRDMALYLLEQGARPTICVAAMLGQLEVVKSFITAFPQMKDTLGPHQIPLLSHAIKGGEHAKHVVAYLKSIGAKE